MTTETLSRDAVKAIEFFEQKLEFEIGPIGLKFALEAKEPLQIIDLRTPELYAKSHVPGAINIAIEDLDKYLPKLNKDVVTVVYCYNITCHLSAKAALHLAKKGYRVKELIGGFNDYAAANLPTEAKSAESCSTTGNCCG